MKKLLLVILVLASLNVSAQKQQEDTIKIPFHAAKQIAKDLVVGDSTKAVLLQTKKELDLTNQANLHKDTIITSLKTKDEYYEDRLRQKDVKFTIEETYANQLAHQNKILKHILKGTLLGASTLIIILSILK
jgi:hypothetical protein